MSIRDQSKITARDSENSMHGGSLEPERPRVGGCASPNGLRAGRLHHGQFLLERSMAKSKVRRMEEAEIPLEHLHEEIHERAEQGGPPWI